MSTKINQKSDTQDQVTEALSNNSFYVKKYQKYSIYEGMLYAVFITCVSGFVITGLQRHLLFTASMIGLISSWSYFGRIVMPLANLFIEKIGTRKTLTIQSRIGSMLVLNLLYYYWLFR